MAIPVTELGVPLLAWGLGYIKPSMGPPSVDYAGVDGDQFIRAVHGGGGGAFFRGVVQRGLVRVMPPALGIGAAAASSRKAQSTASVASSKWDRVSGDRAIPSFTGQAKDFLLRAKLRGV